MIMNKEIERLREDNERLLASNKTLGFERKALDFVLRDLKWDNDELQAEVKRLRELLKKSQPYVEAGLSSCDTRLCEAVAREVGDA